jgi:hypothetical protein
MDCVWAREHAFEGANAADRELLDRKTDQALGCSVRNNLLPCPEPEAKPQTMKTQSNASYIFTHQSTHPSIRFRLGQHAI